MSSLAYIAEPWSRRRMVDTTDYERLERERAGKALQILRRRAGVSQEDAAGRAVGISLSSWKNYENGKRAMDTPTLARALRAIDATPEEHQLEVAKLSAPLPERSSFAGMADRGRVMQLPVGGIAHGGVLHPNLYDNGGEAEVIDFAQYFAPGTQVLKLAGMSMIPYAEPGGFVTYNVRQPARRGRGCVIEFKDGSYAVKRFERMDADTLYVTELFPEERELTFPLADVKGVYAIGGRFD